MDLRTIEWSRGAIKMVDQTRLPEKLVYVRINDVKVLWQAIKLLKVRGAPALGAAAGLGVYLGIKDSKARDYAQFRKELGLVADYIGSSRPTAKNLFWGLERMKRVCIQHKDKSIPQLKQVLFAEALRIVEEDRIACRAIGKNGAQFFRDGDSVLTVCNTGVLATIDYGTALGVIFRAKEDGKKIKVYACETRPLLQGARLTTWELMRNHFDATLICDNMAATVMKQGKVKKVIAGADRIAENGDTANKIGTYSLAVLAQYHKIPFYIAAPVSTFDTSIATGKEIPIEERAAGEVTEMFYKKRMAARGIKVFNPAFDVTPHALIRAIITDKGVIENPDTAKVKRFFAENVDAPK